MINKTRAFNAAGRMRDEARRKFRRASSTLGNNFNKRSEILTVGGVRLRPKLSESIKKSGLGGGRFRTRVVAGAASVWPEATLHALHPAVHALVTARAPSPDSLRAATCAGIHVPSYSAHSIGRRDPGGARHWPTRPASGRFGRR